MVRLFFFINAYATCGVGRVIRRECMVLDCTYCGDRDHIHRDALFVSHRDYLYISACGQR